MQGACGMRCRRERRNQHATDSPTCTPHMLQVPGVCDAKVAAGPVDKSGVICVYTPDYTSEYKWRSRLLHAAHERAAQLAAACSRAERVRKHGRLALISCCMQPSSCCMHTRRGGTHFINPLQTCVRWLKWAQCWRCCCSAHAHMHTRSHTTQQPLQTCVRWRKWAQRWRGCWSSSPRELA